MENKELRNTVESLVQEVERTHRYSMSRIYGAYNEVFGKNEQPQSCASCLIRKIQELKKWLGEQPKPQEVKSPASAVKKTEPKPRKKATKKTSSDKQ